MDDLLDQEELDALLAPWSGELEETTDWVGKVYDKPQETLLSKPKCMSCGDPFFTEEDVHHITGVYDGELCRDIHLCWGCVKFHIGKLPIIELEC